jgi:hypothetical protein
MGPSGKLTARFERVREILRKAAQGHENAFGGLPVWEFSPGKHFLLPNFSPGVRHRVYDQLPEAFFFSVSIRPTR